MSVTIEDPQAVDNTAAPPRSASARSDRTITSSPAESTSSNLALPKTDLTEKVDMLPDDMVEKRKKEKHIGSQVCLIPTDFTSWYWKDLIFMIIVKKKEDLFIFHNFLNLWWMVIAVASMKIQT